MNKHINLLPLKHRRAVLVRNLLLRWGAVWAAAVVLLVAMFWLNQCYYESIDADVQAKEVLCEPVTTAARANRRMREQVRRFEHHETLVGQLRDDKPALNFLAVVSNSASQCMGRIVIRDLLFQQSTMTKLKTKQAAHAAPTGPEAVLTIEGDALDNLAIARFTAALQDAALFRDVELLSSVGKPSSERPMHSFIVRCEI